MEKHFRLKGATKRSEAIEQWLASRPPGLGSVAQQWFARLRACGPAVGELLHDNYPTVCVGDIAFAYIGVFKAHVNLGFFMGLDLQDPARLLEGTGKRMRHVKLRPGTAMDETALQRLVDEAYALAVAAAREN